MHLSRRYAMAKTRGGTHAGSIHCCWNACTRGSPIRDTAEMSSDRSGELLAYARDLELQDEDVARRIEAVSALLRRVDDVRVRAERTRGALDALPAEIGRAEQAVTEALAREVVTRQEAAEAERRLADVQGSKRASHEARVAAERAARRTNVLVTDAAEAVARQQERLQLLLSDQLALRVEAGGLAVEARMVAHDVAGLQRLSESGRKAPGASLGEIEEWGSRAHSAIFVVRGGLEAERERIVHEATALAESALAEQVAGASVSLVRRRLEQELE